jgi:hypothetical protein
VAATAAVAAGASVPAQERGTAGSPRTDLPAFRDLFNGKNLDGWIVAPGAEKTWSVRDGVIFCSGHPNGILRTDRHYENFVLQIDWMHVEPGGNSGLYVWTNAELSPRGLPKGIEIQILDLDWVRLNTREGSPPPPIAYVHGEFIAVNGMKFVPDNPRGERSMALENRAKGRGEWNSYTVVAIDGVIKLAVNGKFVNGIAHATQKKGSGAAIRRRQRFTSATSDPGAALRRDLAEQTAPDLPGARTARPALGAAWRPLQNFCWVGTAPEGPSLVTHKRRMGT